jgi:hypothetical protein
VAASFLTAAENLKQWLVKSDLKREQIVSISCNESVPEDGDAVLVVVYKRHGDASMVQSLENLKFHLTTSVVDWDEQYNNALAEITKERGDIISLTYTPRNVGQINVQLIWYLPQRPEAPFDGYTTKHVTSK